MTPEKCSSHSDHNNIHRNCRNQSGAGAYYALQLRACRVVCAHALSRSMADPGLSLLTGICTLTLWEVYTAHEKAGQLDSNCAKLARHLRGWAGFLFELQQACRQQATGFLVESLQVIPCGVCLALCTALH